MQVQQLFLARSRMSPDRSFIYGSPTHAPQGAVMRITTYGFVDLNTFCATLSMPKMTNDQFDVILTVHRR